MFRFTGFSKNLQRTTERQVNMGQWCTAKVQKTSGKSGCNYPAKQRSSASCKSCACGCGITVYFVLQNPLVEDFQKLIKLCKSDTNELSFTINQLIFCITSMSFIHLEHVATLNGLWARCVLVTTTNHRLDCVVVHSLYKGIKMPLMHVACW